MSYQGNILLNQVYTLTGKHKPQYNQYNKVYYGWCNIVFRGGSKMGVRDQFCINCGLQKKSTENDKETEKATTNTKSFKSAVWKRDRREKIIK